MIYSGGVGFLAPNHPVSAPQPPPTQGHRQMPNDSPARAEQRVPGSPNRASPKVGDDATPATSRFARRGVPRGQPTDKGRDVDPEHELGEPLDISLLDKMASGPEDGTVLRRVEDWIEELENKYAGRALVDRRGLGRVVSAHENDEIVVRDSVRHHISDVPFPSWDGNDEVVEKEDAPPPTPVQYHDYDPELRAADDEPEDDDADDRDAGARLVKAYSGSCQKHSKSAIPQVMEVLSRRRVDGGVLSLASCSMGDGGITALGPFLGQLVGLTTLDLCANMIFDDGAAALAKGLKTCVKLTTLLLDDNKLGTAGAVALAEQFKQKKSSLTYLSVRKCQLSDGAVSAIVDALALRKQIVKLVIGHNAVGQQSCYALAGLLLSSRTIEHLDCHWGHMRGEGAVEFSKALVSAEVLKYLDVGWNGFGDGRPCHYLAESLKLKACALEHVDLSHNRINEQAAFLIAGPLEYNKSIQKLIMDGNPIGQSGCRRIMGSCLGFKNQSVEQTEKEERTIEVSLQDCSFGTVSVSSFDPSEPAGEYLFDMADPYARLVIRDLLKIEALGKGEFVRHTIRLEGEPYDLKPMVDFDREPKVPEEGEMAFRFVSLRKPPWAGGDTELHHSVFNVLLEHFGDNSKPAPGEQKMGKIEYLLVLITADTVFSYDQAAQLIVLLLSSEERVQFLLNIYHKFNEPDGNKRLARNFLSEAEQKQLKKLLGPTAFAFTPNNPTGHHLLDLSTKEERDVGIKILDARNGNQEIIAEMREKMQGRAGGPREAIEPCWLNATLDGQPLQYERHLKLPRTGMLEIDFCSLVKPQDIDKNVAPLGNDQWSELIEECEECDTMFECLCEFRTLSNTGVFTIRQVRQFLKFVDKKFDELKEDVVVKKNKSASAVSQERPLELSKYRIEVIVTAYARTLDYLGFFGIYGLLNTDLSRSERAMLQERIHSINMFCSEMAVDFYELDLSDKTQRFVMQEIIYLAILEPGQNCVNETYNDMDFPIPAPWVKEAPRNGIFCTYYCREQDTIDKINAECNRKHPGSVPDKKDVEIPAFTDWVISAKCHQIKQKMSDKFATAKSCFKAIDKDGGGTIDRKEMAGGLFRLGVWLRPTELKTLFEVIDEDDGGDVDLQEFEFFWNETDEAARKLTAKGRS